MSISERREEVSDYDFLSMGPKLAEPHQLLINAGLALGVRSLTTGENHPILQQAAELHASYQASLGRQGHFEWQQRSDTLRDLMPDCSEFAECCAESWPWQSMVEAAPDMYKSWKQSPGHWSRIDGGCSYYGYAMAMNERQNIWYATAIFAILRDRAAVA